MSQGVSNAITSGIATKRAFVTFVSHRGSPSEVKNSELGFDPSALVVNNEPEVERKDSACTEFGHLDGEEEFRVRA